MIEMESQLRDLDTGTVRRPSHEDLLASAGADSKLTYHADRSPHAMVAPVSQGVDMAFVANGGFDGVTSEYLANMAFPDEPVDALFTVFAYMVICTDQGAVHTIGSASESDVSINLSYAIL